MVKIERIRCGNGNCFLVYDSGKVILVDTATKPYRDKILKACLGKEVGLIVLTHGHIDHVSNAAYLSQALDAPIGMSAYDNELIDNNNAQEMKAHTILGKVLLSVSMKRFNSRLAESFKPTVALKDGDSLTSYGIDAKIIALPGHTKGSIGLLVGDGDLIVGDALMNIFYPTVSMLYGDREKVKTSAALISDTQVKRIHFGHGKSVELKRIGIC